MRSATTVVLLAGLALISWQMSAASHAQAPQPLSEKIGVVDLTKVFNDYEKFNVQSEALRKRRDEIEAQLRELAAEMRSLKERRDNFKSDSPEYRQFTDQLEERQLKGQQILKREERELAENLGSLMSTVYKELLAAVDAYAKEHGYTLILKTSVDTIPSNNPELVQRFIGGRMVLYGRAENDITQAVAERLNASFKAAQSSP